MSDAADQSAVDRESVAAQLGRPPRGRWSVARRCACGKPSVIQTSSHLDDGTPFPTLWWLTCRDLSRRVGRLESGGWMAGFNQRLATEEALAAALVDATSNYAAARDALEPLGEGPGARLRAHPGGGGMPGAGPRVKCLHAHTAQHLVTGDNPVGAAVLAQLSWVEPQEPCV